MQWTKQGSVVLWCVQPVQLTIITTLTLPPPLVAVECGSERENKQVVTWRKSRCSRARFQLEMVTILSGKHIGSSISLILGRMKILSKTTIYVIFSCPLMLFCTCCYFSAPTPHSSSRSISWRSRTGRAPVALQSPSSVREVCCCVSQSRESLLTTVLS